MNRRRFLGWLGRGAALSIVLPAADLVWTPAQAAQVRQSAIEYLLAWHRRCPHGERGDILASAALFDAYESELNDNSRILIDDWAFGAVLYLKGRRVFRKDDWDGWRVATAGTYAALDRSPTANFWRS